MGEGPPPGLDAAVRALPRPVFAVCDGAAYDDLPAALRAAGLWPRSLFLEVPQREAARAGPWLVPLAVDRWRDDIAEVLGVLGTGARAVFWAWPTRGRASTPARRRWTRCTATCGA